MSNHLISLAYKVNVGSLLRKAVLCLLADKASDDGSGIWASKQTMADELCCSKQAVINTIAAFLDEGLLVESGQRRCRTGYTVSYQIVVPVLESLDRVDRWSDQSKTLTGKPNGPVNGMDATGQPGGPKPSLTPPGSEANASKPRAKHSRPTGVSAEQWQAFKAQRKKPLTGRAYTLLTNKLTALAEAGYPPGDMIDLAIERGWETVFKPREQRLERHDTSIGRGAQAFARLNLSDDCPM